MNPLSRTVAKTLNAWQVGKNLPVGHPRPARISWWWTPAGHMRQLPSVRDGSANSITQACLTALTDAFSEAPVRITATSGGQTETVEGHPAAELVENPNPHMTVDLLWHYYIWSTRIDGNAYFYKARSAGGLPVELWPLRPDLVEPRPPDTQDPTRLIGHYAYRPRGTEQRIPPEDIIHLRLGLDPHDHRRGVGPIKTVLKEILADEEASQFATALLANMAIPSVLLTPPPGHFGPDPTQTEAVKEGFTESFGGDRRGGVSIMSDALIPHILSFSPEQMNFEVLRRVPEERITAALRVPAIIAGMGAGLKATSGRAESNTLLEYFTRTTVVADWRRVGRQLTRQLLPDFTADRRLQVGFDLSQVVALQDDQTEIWKRADMGVRSGWLTVAEAKRMCGLDPDPADDVYLRSMATAAVEA